MKEIMVPSPLIIDDPIILENTRKYVRKDIASMLAQIDDVNRLYRIHDNIAQEWLIVTNPHVLEWEEEMGK